MILNAAKEVSKMDGVDKRTGNWGSESVLTKPIDQHTLQRISS
jgi:hypothetical protein